MTECDIQAVLGCRYGVDKGQIVIPNVLLGSYEADFITITKSDYLIEVEIKISISDFRADFKKKHYHDCPKVNALYYAFSTELYEKHKEEIDESCEKVGAGIILIAEKKLPKWDSYYLDGIAKKPKLRKAKPLTADQKYYLSQKACLGILRRAKTRGKVLPEILHKALTRQAGLSSQESPVEMDAS